MALGKAVEGRYLDQFKPEDRTINKYKFQHSVLKCVDDKDSNLIQMVDLLTGAVAFVRKPPGFIICRTESFTNHRRLSGDFETAG